MYSMNVREAHTLIASLEEPYLRAAFEADEGQPLTPIPKPAVLPPPNNVARTIDPAGDLLCIMQPFFDAQSALRKVLSDFSLESTRALTASESRKVIGMDEWTAWNNELVLPADIERTVTEGVETSRRLLAQSLSDIGAYMRPTS